MSKRNKPSNSHQPHDEFVKNSLKDKTIAQDLMRHTLPANLLKNLDLTTLELDKNTYITPELKQYFSDLVWQCQYKEEKIQIAILLEHKSSPVPYPHLQLLRYMLEIWEVNQQQKQPIVPIVPIILYHGEKKWTVRPMTAYFKGIDSTLYSYIPNFNYEMVNVSQYEEDDILKLDVGLLKNFLLALRFYRDMAYLRHKFGSFFIQIEAHGSDAQVLNFIQTLLVYLLKTTEFSDKEIYDMVNQIPSPINDMTMSSYDVLIEKGIEKGIEKEKIEVIKNLRLEGSTIEFIAKIVNAPMNRVRQILDKLGIE